MLTLRCGNHLAVSDVDRGEPFPSSVRPSCRASGDPGRMGVKLMSGRDADQRYRALHQRARNHLQISEWIEQADS